MQDSRLDRLMDWVCLFACLATLVYVLLQMVRVGWL